MACISTCGLLTTEDDDVKLSIAQRLVLVGDAGPETAPLPQCKSQQNLTLLFVGGHRLAVVLLHAVIIHCAQRVYMDAVVGLIHQRHGVTGGVSILVSWLNLQGVLLAVGQDQCGEMIRYLCFGWNHCA